MWDPYKAEHIEKLEKAQKESYQENSQHVKSNLPWQAKNFRITYTDLQTTKMGPPRNIQDPKWLIW